MNAIVEATVITLPELKDGERYAGILLDDAGAPAHHLILLPGDEESLTWAKAKAFAAKAGGALPGRREQALLFANLPGAFERDWYWSGEQHASNSSYAWMQGFGSGTQGTDDKSVPCRARAVRRSPI